jgi:DNA-binding response OmpR family regulator
MTGKVLVMDDEWRIRDILSSLLKAEGYEVIEASNGDEAGDLAEREAPQLILLDIQLPGVDGIEAYERLKTNEKTRCIPIIMVSGLEDNNMQAVEAGADDFLDKPFIIADVFTRVRWALSIRHLTDELERAMAYIEDLK